MSSKSIFGLKRQNPIWKEIILGIVLAVLVLYVYVMIPTESIKPMILYRKRIFFSVDLNFAQVKTFKIFNARSVEEQFQIFTKSFR